MIASIGKYRIIDELGSGNFGTVYKALDITLNDIRAVKVLHCSNKLEILKGLKEAEVPYKLKHRNIVGVKSTDLYSEVPDKTDVIIDMDYIEGGSLESGIEKKFFSVESSLHIISDALFGLEHAHINGVIHRDIKPANILIDNNVAKISDFGLWKPFKARIANTDAFYYTHTPQEVLRTKVVNYQTDIFAMGITLYRTVNNIKDWIQFISSISNVNSLIQNGQLINKLPFENYVPRQVIRIVKTACHVDPKKRYGSACEFRQAIEKLRFNVDWQKESEIRWIGRDQKNVNHEIFIETKQRHYIVTHKKRGLTVRSDTKSFSDMTSAINSMSEHIRESTLQ